MANRTKIRNVCSFDCGENTIKCYCEIDGKEYISNIQISHNFTTKRDFLFLVGNFIDSIPADIDTIGITFPGLCTATKLYETSFSYLENLASTDFVHLDCNVIFINHGHASLVCAFQEYPDANVIVTGTSNMEILYGTRIGSELFVGNFGIVGKIPSNMVDNQNFRFLFTNVISMVKPDLICLSSNFYHCYQSMIDSLKNYSNYSIVTFSKELYTNCIGATVYAKNFDIHQERNT